MPQTTQTPYVIDPLAQHRDPYLANYYQQVGQQFQGQAAPAGTVDPNVNALGQQASGVLSQHLSGQAIPGSAVQRAATAAVQPYAQSGTLGSARSQLAAATAGANVAGGLQQQALQNLPGTVQAIAQPQQQAQEAQQAWLQNYYNTLGLGQIPATAGLSENTQQTDAERILEYVTTLGAFNTLTGGGDGGRGLVDRGLGLLGIES